jgi:hypothetical protein
MTFSPKGACFEIRLIGRDKNNDHVEICKTVSPLKSTEPQRKSSREGTFFLVDDLSESRGLTPEEPKYALPTGVGYRRRMAVGKDLAEPVRFELTVRLPILAGSPRSIPGHAVQSNQVSGTILQKTGTMRKTRRDFRRVGPRNHPIRNTETLRLMREARQRQASRRHGNENTWRQDWVAGAPGFEPGNGGIKIRLFRVIYQSPFRKSHEYRR